MIEVKAFYYFHTYEGLMFGIPGPEENKKKLESAKTHFINMWGEKPVRLLNPDWEAARLLPNIPEKKRREAFLESLLPDMMCYLYLKINDNKGIESELVVVWWDNPEEFFKKPLIEIFNKRIADFQSSNNQTLPIITAQERKARWTKKGLCRSLKFEIQSYDHNLRLTRFYYEQACEMTEEEALGRARIFFSGNAPCYIIPQEKKFSNFPAHSRIVCFVELESYHPVRGEDNDYCSWLVVIWFAQKALLNESMPKILAYSFPDLPWETEAHNFLL
ncbi:hypothetical protein [Candidatus Uabimicrobium sp. HlEnr_7]|uniref:hypothetical protein n=1 Tax=Candidatus Uabimicrobium helgolandensis TaxID=3095367 RepID=UPI0035583692